MTVHEEMTIDEASAVYEVLAEHLDAFCRAWEEGGESPALAEFLPEQPAALRRLGLVELIKLDLEQRGKRQCPRELEDYCRDFPELLSDGAPPVDLIYEDFHIRKQAGDEVDPQKYLERFPQQATVLERLLNVDSPYRSTTSYSRESIVDVEAGEQLDDFYLIQQLGAGGFAKVFLAQQKEMQRLVALKISSGRSDEPQALAKLDHPHIVRVFDQRLVPERRWLLLYMQYVPGGTLEQAIKRVHGEDQYERSGRGILQVIDATLQARGETPPTDSPLRKALAERKWIDASCWMVARLASALEYAHSRGVLHRDVKPANVLLTAVGNPQLADFNISFSSEVEGASPRTFFGGSLPYMSPEQLEAYHPERARQAESLDARSDVYSLGVVLFEMVAGERPFQDTVLPTSIKDTLNDMIARRRDGVTHDVEARLPADCPDQLKQTLKECLRSDPEQRIDSATALLRRLELQLLPALQALLHPPRRGLQASVVRWPVLMIALAVLIPLVPVSGLNLFYNFGSNVPGFDAQQRQAFGELILPLNAVCALGSLLLGVWYIGPILGALRQVRSGQALGDDEWRRVGPRTLNFGFFLAVVIFAAWILSGLAFTLGVDMRTPEPVSGETYFHFAMSQTLHGLINGAFVFFLVTFLAVRAIYPRFIPLEPEPSTADADLMRTRRRVTMCSIVLGATPLLAVMGVAARQLDSTPLFVGLALLGLAGYFVSLALSPQIQRDIDNLRLAVLPTDEMVRRLRG